jgi:ParB family chromosome partitioning protein
MSEKRRLGRGLDALLGGAAPTEAAGAATATQATELPIAQIAINPYQPRKDFDEEEMAALKSSLATHGLLNPVLVRATEAGYQLIAGERRLRAAKEVGWEQIPVTIVDFNDQKVFEAALVENLQRTDLNPIEKAQGFHEYLQRYKVTQEELARTLGLDRSTISNLIRLLELPATVQDAVRMGQISNGHARALLPLEDQEKQTQLCKEIIAKGLSVRQVELTVKEMKAAPTAEAGTATEKPAVEKTAHVQQIEDHLRQMFSAKVAIKLKAPDKGQIVINFENNDDFERITQALRKPA